MHKFENIHIIYVGCVVATESKSGRFELEALCRQWIYGNFAV